MVSSLMQTSSMALANRAPFTSRPVPCRAVAPQRTRVVAAASQVGCWPEPRALDAQGGRGVHSLRDSSPRHVGMWTCSAWPAIRSGEQGRAEQHTAAIELPTFGQYTRGALLLPGLPPFLF